MTTYGIDTICKDLQTEIKKAILKIVPSERGSERFRPFDPGIHGALSEQTAVPRTFWINPISATPKWVGTPQRRYDVMWDCTIGYPPRGWEICSMSDYDDIRAAVNAFGGYSSVTGCAFRVVAPQTPIIESDANWMWSHVRIVSVVETTDTTKTLPNYQNETETSVTVAGSPVTLYSFTPTSNGSISWSYHILSSDEKTSRGGIVAAAWDLGSETVVHFDESTDDIAAAGATYANTTNLVFNVTMTGGVLYLKASSAGGTWTVRTTEIARSEA